MGAANATTVQRRHILNTARGIPFAPWTPYAALLTAVSNPLAGTVTEISCTGYARQLIIFAAPSTVAGVERMPSSAILTFPTMTGGAGGTATHLGIYDALTGGTLRYIIELDAPGIIAATLYADFASGQIYLQQE